MQEIFKLRVHSRIYFYEYTSISKKNRSLRKICSLAFAILIFFFVNHSVLVRQLPPVLNRGSLPLRLPILLQNILLLQCLAIFLILKWLNRDSQVLVNESTILFIGHPRPSKVKNFIKITEPNTLSRDLGSKGLTERYHFTAIFWMPLKSLSRIGMQLTALLLK